MPRNEEPQGEACACTNNKTQEGEQITEHQPRSTHPRDAFSWNMYGMLNTLAQRKAFLVSHGVQIPILKDFPMEKVTQDTVNLFLGKRHTGKTVGMQNVARKLVMDDKVVDGAIAFSRTERLNYKWNEHFAAQYCHPDYSNLVMKKAFERLASLKSRVKLKQLTWQRYKATLCILDDLVSDDTLRYDDDINTAFVNGRHFGGKVKTLGGEEKMFGGLCVLMSTQYPLAIRPIMRNNADFAYIFRVGGPQELDLLHKTYGGNLHKRVFQVLLDEHTEDYGCMVVDKRSNSADITEVLYKKQFEFPVPEFKLGTGKEWELSKKLMKQRLQKLAKGPATMDDLEVEEDARDFNIDRVIAEVIPDTQLTTKKK